MLYHTHPLAVFAICLTLGAGMWAQPLSAQEFRTLPDGFPDIPYYVNNLSVYEIGQEDNFLQRISKGYSNAVFAAKNYTNAYSNDLLLGRRKIVETEVRYKNLIGFKIFAPGEYNSLLYLEDGYLASANPKESPEDIQKIATKIKGLSETAKAAGSTFFYVQTPGNINKYGDEGINQVQDFSNQNADLLVEDLRAYGIDCLDIRDNMLAVKIPFSSIWVGDEAGQTWSNAAPKE